MDLEPDPLCNHETNAGTQDWAWILVFYSVAFKVPTKNKLFSFLSFFCVLLLKGTFTSVLKQSKLYKTIEIKVFLIFCLLKEGSESCSEPDLDPDPYKQLRIRILGAQNLGYPNPEHWLHLWEN